jgi:hypothetical protein
MGETPIHWGATFSFLHNSLNFSGFKNTFQFRPFDHMFGGQKKIILWLKQAEDIRQTLLTDQHSVGLNGFLITGVQTHLTWQSSRQVPCVPLLTTYLYCQTNYCKKDTRGERGNLYYSHRKGFNSLSFRIIPWSIVLITRCFITSNTYLLTPWSRVLLEQ